VKLGTENRNKTIAAAALGVLAVFAVIYLVSSTWSGSSATSAASAASVPVPVATPAPAARRTSSPTTKKKFAPPDSLDPTLRLDLLASSEQVHYAGSGRNIFMSQPDPEIPKPVSSGAAEAAAAAAAAYTPPTPPPPPPINLKFYGFASQPGEAKRVFLMQGEDTFIAGEGDIVNRRYKVVKITNTAVEVQDLLSSGPPQTIPLSQV
jgi:hypothetical protein